MKYGLLGLMIGISAWAAPTKVVKVSLGGFHGCALIEGIGESGAKFRRLQCFGANDKRQSAGIGEYSPTPKDPSLPVLDFGGDIVDFAASAHSTCAIMANESIRCVGENFTTKVIHHATMSPELNVKSEKPFEFRLPNDAPVAIVAPEGAGFSDQYCVRTKSDRVHCFRQSDIVPWVRRQFAKDWPDLFFAQKNLNPHTNVFSMGRGVKEISVSGNRLCALLDNQRLKCLERGNEYGTWGAADIAVLEKSAAQLKEKNLALPSLSDEDGDYSDAAYELPFGNPVTSVTAGRFVNCATFEDGTGKCWGIWDRDFPVPTFEPWYVYLLKGTQVTAPQNPQPAKGRLFKIAPQGRKVTKIFTDGLHRVCVQMSPGAEDLSSNVKCIYRDEIEKLSENAKNSPDFIDSLPWLSLGLPVVSLTYGGEQVVERACAILQNNGLKCWGSSYQGSAGQPTEFRDNKYLSANAELPFLNF